MVPAPRSRLTVTRPPALGVLGTLYASDAAGTRLTPLQRGPDARRVGCECCVRHMHQKCVAVFYPYRNVCYKCACVYVCYVCRSPEHRDGLQRRVARRHRPVTALFYLLMCMCVGVWVCGCMGVWVCSCACMRFCASQCAYVHVCMRS